MASAAGTLHSTGGITATLFKNTWRASAKSPKPKSHGGPKFYPGYAVKIKADQWSEFTPGSGYGPFQDFPINLPTSGAGLTAHLQYDHTHVNSGIIWGRYAITGDFQGAAQNYSNDLTLGGGSTVYRPNANFEGTLYFDVDIHDIDLINFGQFTGIGNAGSQFGRGGSIFAITCVLYRIPHP